MEFKGSHSEPVLVDISVSPSAISDLDDDPSPIPSLTYSSINTPIHQYEEELNRLLTALDAVESGGDRKIRESRRELVKKVEKEAQRLERWKVTVWRAGRTTHGENNSTIPTISQPENPSEGIPEAVSLDLQETPLHTEHPEATPEPEEPSLSVATAEEPFFDASATLEDNASEDMGSVLIPSPSGSLPETDKFGSCMERRIDGLGRPKSPLVGQGWDVLDVFDML